MLLLLLYRLSRGKQGFLFHDSSKLALRMRKILRVLLNYRIQCVAYNNRGTLNLQPRPISLSTNAIEQLND
jgi:hypothetical protein